MKFHAILILAVLSILLMASDAGAEVPLLVNYQGYLTDLDGTPLNGNHELTFEIFADEAMSGPALWVEVHQPADVLVVDGLFNVILGGIEPIDDRLFEYSDERWLSVAVEREAVI